MTPVVSHNWLMIQPEAQTVPTPILSASEELVDMTTDFYRLLGRFGFQIHWSLIIACSTAMPLLHQGKAWVDSF